MIMLADSSAILQVLADHNDKLRVVLELLLLYASTMTARGGNLFPQDAEGGCLSMTEEDVAVLCGAVLLSSVPPAAASAIADGEEFPSPTLLQTHRDVLEALSTDKHNESLIREHLVKRN